MAYGNGKQCKAKSKRTGERCKANCVTGRDVCYHHGGKSLGGLASPRITHGLYSKFLPAKLSSQYENLLTLGQDLFRIDDETAALTTLIQEQLSKIEAGESGAAWGKLQSLYNEMEVLGQKPNKSAADIQQFNALFLELGEVTNYGSMIYAARNEAVGLMEQKRKLVADERKDWAAKHQAMSFDRVMLLLTCVVQGFKVALEKHISDDDARKAVLIDTQGALNKVVR